METIVKMRKLLLLFNIFVVVGLFSFSVLKAEEKEDNKGFLTVHTIPAGLDIYVDGKKVGISPLEKMELPVGTHQLSIATEPCFKQILFYTWNRNVNISDSDTTFLEITPEPIMKEIKISDLKVEDQVLKGNAIYVDGVKVGTVPGKIDIPICSKLLEVTEKNGNRVIYGSNLDLVKGEITKNKKNGYEIVTKKEKKSEKVAATNTKEFKPPVTTDKKSEFKPIKINKKEKRQIIGPYKWVGTGFIVGGAILAGIGGMFDYMAWKKFNDYAKMGTEEEIREQLSDGDISKADYLIKRDDIYQKGKDFIIARNIFYAAGGASALTGIILLFVKPSKKEKKVETSFRILPGPDSFFISTDISF